MDSVFLAKSVSLQLRVHKAIVSKVKCTQYDDGEDSGDDLSSSNISGDHALASRQSKKCPQKHGGFWPNLHHYDVVSPLFQDLPLTK